MATIDSGRFDALTRTVSTSGTRRGVLRLLGGLPLAAGLAALLGEEPDAAAHKDPERGSSHRRHRRKAKHRHQTGDDKDNRKGKGKRRTKDTGQTPQANPAGQPGCGPGRCAAGQVCAGGSCRVCDVCASGCVYSSVQAALDAASDDATIRLCAGTYQGNLDIIRGVTLIGAGDGDDPATNTILDAAGSGRVMLIQQRLMRQPVAVTLQSLRITGGVLPSHDGGGIMNEYATLRLIDTTVTGNTAGLGGGIRNNSGTLTLIASTVTGNTASDSDAGGILNAAGTLTIDGASQVTFNRAKYHGGGIASWEGTVTIDVDSKVTFNRAGEEGGGIYNFQGTVTLTNEQNVINNCPDNCAIFFHNTTPVAHCAAEPTFCPSP